MAAKRQVILKELRTLMKISNYVGQEPIHAYIIPSGDAHQSEYLAACDMRRSFISGFTGSAGTAIVTENHACMWTDGRYFLQASQEMTNDWTLMKEGVPSTPTQGSWLVKNLTANSRVGFDPRLMSLSAIRPLKTQLDAAGIHLIPLEANFIDLIWGPDQPKRPTDPILPLPIKYTGLSAANKVSSVREQMQEKGASLLVFSALDQIAWLLNLRGSDIPFNPVFFSYASVGTSEVSLFVEEAKVTPAVHEHFAAEGLNVNIQPYVAIKEHIVAKLAQLEPGHKIWISEASSYALCSLVPDNHLITEVSPVAITKTIKNPTEIQGMINCHIRDAAALCCYFAWLEREVASGNVVTEVSGATKLEQFRQEQSDYVGLSFETISSVGPNAAVIHYKPMPETDRRITDKEVYLCDSGGQFKDGTTDGNCLDTLARKPLWDVGLDYMHGTSHGIGSYLNVHEGPIGISWRTMPDDPGLQADMFLSNEPGYYEDGNFGIRIENIVRVIPAKARFNFKERGFLTFDDVTLMPIQTKMLVKDMMSQQQIDYLNAYHIECRNKVGSVLRSQGHEDAIAWLERETKPF